MIVHLVVGAALISLAIASGLAVEHLIGTRRRRGPNGQEMGS